MECGRVWWRLAVVLASVNLMVGTARSQSGDNAAALYDELGRLYSAGQYAEATEIAQRLLDGTVKALGSEHPKVGGALSNLAMLYEAQGHYSEAEQLYKRGFAVLEKALGPNHLAVGGNLTHLADLYRKQGRYTESRAAVEPRPCYSPEGAGPGSC